MGGELIWHGIYDHRRCTSARLTVAASTGRVRPMDTDLLDRILSAAEEIQGKTFNWTEVSDSPLEGQVPEADLIVEFRGHRFAVFCGGPADEPGECSILLPLTDYAVPVDAAMLLPLVEACQRARLAVGRDESDPNARPYLIGVDYSMPSESITGNTLRWVIDSLLSDLKNVERVLGDE